MNKRINRTDKLDDALQAWNDHDHALNHVPVKLYTTEGGNINSHGELGNYRGHMLTRHHDVFLNAIEPGVRPIVCAIIAQGWVTYSSCEGHSYMGLDLTPVERHVGIVPLSHTELDLMLDKFTWVQKKLELCELQPIHVALHQVTIDSDTTARQAVEVWFERDSAVSWQAYFTYLDPYCEAFIWLLTELQAQSNSQLAQGPI